MALRFAQSLLAAGRTAAEIAPFRRLAIEGGGDRLCSDDRFMDGAIAEIDDTVAVVPAEDKVGAAMPGIGADRDLAVGQPRDHLLIGNVGDIGDRKSTRLNSSH